TERRNHCSLAYSALACFRMGMSGSASFQRAKKRSLRQAHPLQQFDVAWIGAERIERTNDFDDLQGSGFFGYRFVQPGEGLRFIAQVCIGVGNVGGVNVPALSQLLP